MMSMAVPAVIGAMIVISLLGSEKVGEFPPWDFRHLAPSAPSDATLRWIQSQNIRWAKSRRSA